MQRGERDDLGSYVQDSGDVKRAKLVLTFRTCPSDKLMLCNDKTIKQLHSIKITAISRVHD